MGNWLNLWHSFSERILEESHFLASSSALPIQLKVTFREGLLTNAMDSPLSNGLLDEMIKMNGDSVDSTSLGYENVMSRSNGCLISHFTSLRIQPSAFRLQYQHSFLQSFLVTHLSTLHRWYDWLYTLDRLWFLLFNTQLADFRVSLWVSEKSALHVHQNCTCWSTYWFSVDFRTMSSLMSLPREIRDNIYDLCLVYEDEIVPFTSPCE